MAKMIHVPSKMFIIFFFWWTISSVSWFLLLVDAFTTLRYDSSPHHHGLRMKRRLSSASFLSRTTTSASTSSSSNMTTTTTTTTITTSNDNNNSINCINNYNNNMYNNNNSDSINNGMSFDHQESMMMLPDAEMQTSSLSSSISSSVAAAAAATGQSSIQNQNDSHDSTRRRRPTTTTTAAIVLNRNARQVTPALESMIVSIFGPEHVYGTSTEEEAQRIASTCLINQTTTKDNNNNNYSMIIPIGGDGTLASLIQFMCDGIMNTSTTSHTTTTTNATTTTTNSMSSIDDQEESTKMTISQAMASLPLLAYIPMGTGNGVGSVVGCSPPLSLQREEIEGRSGRTIRQRLSSLSFFFGRRRRRKLQQLETTLRQLKTISENMDQYQDTYEIVELPMIQVTSKITTTPTTTTNTTSTTDSKQEQQERSDLCFFAGIGFDSLLLHDFQQIKAWSKRRGGIVKQFLSSVAGYCVALIVKTLPQCALSGKHKVQVELTTRKTTTNDTTNTTTTSSSKGSDRSSPTFWIDHRRGDMALPCHEGLLYKGSTGILSASTSPYYGGGLRMFPFSRITTENTMHVRLGRIHPLTGCMHLPSIFAGSYRDKTNAFGILDFIGRDFDVKITNQNYNHENNNKKNGGGGGETEDDNNNNNSETTDDHGDATADGFPLQHSGDSIGSTKQFRLRVVDAPVRFVSLWEPRVVIEEQQ